VQLYFSHSSIRRSRFRFRSRESGHVRLASLTGRGRGKKSCLGRQRNTPTRRTLPGSSVSRPFVPRSWTLTITEFAIDYSHGHLASTLHRSGGEWLASAINRYIRKSVATILRRRYAFYKYLIFQNVIPDSNNGKEPIFYKTFRENT
jgi:hypothetical protein